MADIPAFYGWLQKQITMKTDRLPPRERGLQPTHFIQIYGPLQKPSDITKQQSYRTSRYGIDFLNYALNHCPQNSKLHTIAILKIYPKHK